MTAFTFDNPGGRVVFGKGSVACVADETARMGVARILIVSTPGRAPVIDPIALRLGARFAGKFTEAVPHGPEAVVQSAREAAALVAADCVVAFGGGSAIGVAKALALTENLRIVAVPTTYGGSEMTSIWGLTRNGVKETGRDPRVRPEVVIYDPELTLALPPRTTACSGLNALAHCVEATYSLELNPFSSGAAMQGIFLLADALPLLAETPQDLEQRSNALQGAWLAGFALDTAQMGLHHKLCHTLGGSFDLPHAETHAVLLPYAMAYNRNAASPAMLAIADILGHQDAPSAVLALAKQIGAPLTLAELGFRESDIDRAAALAAERQYPNPEAVTERGIRELLKAALVGDSGYVAPS